MIPLRWRRTFRYRIARILDHDPAVCWEKLVQWGIGDGRLRDCWTDCKTPCWCGKKQTMDDREAKLLRQVLDGDFRTTVTLDSPGLWDRFCEWWNRPGEPWRKSRATGWAGWRSAWGSSGTGCGQCREASKCYPCCDPSR